MRGFAENIRQRNLLLHESFYHTPGEAGNIELRTAMFQASIVEVAEMRMSVFAMAPNLEPGRVLSQKKGGIRDLDRRKVTASCKGVQIFWGLVHEGRGK